MWEITTYIPCYIWNEKKFYERLWITIDSIRQYKKFWTIKLFICQLNKQQKLKEYIKRYDDITIIFLKENYPIFFPIDVFNYMKNDKVLHDNDYVFYVEWDHILHIDNQFFDNIYQEIDKWNIVMPHRLWTSKADKRDYLEFNWYLVWNYSKTCIIKYSKDFNIVIPYLWPNNEVYGTYAWCYFTNKKTLSNIKDFHVKHWILGIFQKYIWIFHRFWIFKNVWLPYMMKLETPSLILPLRNLTVLKPVEIKNCYVIHLSWNWYV